MAIEIGTPNGPFIIGPGATVRATSDLLGLANPPYNWTFQFTAPDNTFTFEHHVTTDEPLENAVFRVQWTDLDTPAPLLMQVHARLNDSIRVTATVRNEVGEPLDGPLVVQVPWDPIAWLHANMGFWSNNLVGRITAGGGGTDKIDQILAAVYRTWPSA